MNSHELSHELKDYSKLLNTNIKEHYCNFCNKSFKHKQSKYNHQKNIVKIIKIMMIIYKKN